MFAFVWLFLVFESYEIGNGFKKLFWWHIQWMELKPRVNSFVDHKWQQKGKELYNNVNHKEETDPNIRQYSSGFYIRLSTTHYPNVTWLSSYIITTHMSMRTSEQTLYLTVVQKEERTKWAIRCRSFVPKKIYPTWCSPSWRGLPWDWGWTCGSCPRRSTRPALSWGWGPP